MRTINVYKYNELPTEEAKERAREWWKTQEQEDPAWFAEHLTSMHTALNDIKGESYTYEEIINRSEACEYTGYHADILLADLLKELGHMPTPQQVQDYYYKAWENELGARLEDNEYIAQTIEANEYEFTEYGTRYE